MQGAIDSHEHQGIVPRAVRALGEGIAADTTPGAEYEVGPWRCRPPWTHLPCMCRSNHKPAFPATYHFALHSRSPDSHPYLFHPSPDARTHTPLFLQLNITHTLACSTPHPIPCSDTQVRISVVEIYCERIRDLLDPSGTADNLQVKQDPERGICVEGGRQ